MRSSSRVLLSFSRMLDMGGMPSAATSKAMRPLDASKNCKVRCIAFDFDLLTRTVQTADQLAAVAAAAAEELKKVDSKISAPIQPDIGMVQQMANLLNVNLGGTVAASVPQTKDDLSALLADNERKKEEQKPISAKSSNPLLSMDIRNKYAKKLRNKIEGGVPGIELARSRVDEALTKGDAAGHLAARAMAVSSGGNTETKWMALTGTGALLQYITNRSLKIALLPKPNNEHAAIEAKRMNDFTRQLPNVSFDWLVEKGDTAHEILGSLLDGLSSTDALSTMVISDRDDYLRSAKEAGMTTCRVRPSTNAPRGNVSAHYNVNKMAEVQDVVNDINGISFNAVFASR